jgi:hypothetical protein
MNSPVAAPATRNGKKGELASQPARRSPDKNLRCAAIGNKLNHD